MFILDNISAQGAETFNIHPHPAASSAQAMSAASSTMPHMPPMVHMGAQGTMGHGVSTDLGGMHQPTGDAGGGGVFNNQATASMNNFPQSNYMNMSQGM